MEFEQGGGGGGRQPLHVRVQNFLDGMWAELDLWLVIKAVVCVLLLTGTIALVALGLTGHQHPNVPALWCHPNATVSLNGKHGEFSTISAALSSAPSFSNSTFCIHIRGGRYIENVVVDSDKTNIVFAGDGAEKTIIAANRNCQGCEMLATLRLRGAGFTAVDLTVENYETLSEMPTAAVDNWSDRSIFYRCRLVSRHDVVRALLSPQFYRDSHIQGSGLLIHGVAEAFFQNCSIAVDGTVENETYTVAESERGDSDTIQSFTFYQCNISAIGTPTSTPILGSALAPYARIVYLECIINIQGGWSSNGFAPGTIFFGVYGITGTGSISSSPDLHTLNFTSASQLSVWKFFEDNWLPTNVPNKPNLSVVN